MIAADFGDKLIVDGEEAAARAQAGKEERNDDMIKV